MKTKEKVLEIKSKISDLEDELQLLKDHCQHTDVVYKYNSNTGNYCPSDDSYWNDVVCLCCGEHFMFDSEKDDVDYRLKGVIGSGLQIKEGDLAVLKAYGKV